jgi:hypothetical protein
VAPSVGDGVADGHTSVTSNLPVHPVGDSANQPDTFFSCDVSDIQNPYELSILLLIDRTVKKSATVNEICDMVKKIPKRQIQRYVLELCKKNRIKRKGRILFLKTSPQTFTSKQTFSESEKTSPQTFTSPVNVKRLTNVTNKQKEKKKTKITPSASSPISVESDLLETSIIEPATEFVDNKSSFDGHIFNQHVKPNAFIQRILNFIQKSDNPEEKLQSFTRAIFWWTTRLATTKSGFAFLSKDAVKKQWDFLPFVFAFLSTFHADYKRIQHCEDLMRELKLTYGDKWLAHLIFDARHASFECEMGWEADWKDNLSNRVMGRIIKSNFPQFFSREKLFAMMDGFAGNKLNIIAGYYSQRIFTKEQYQKLQAARTTELLEEHR